MRRGAADGTQTGRGGTDSSRRPLDRAAAYPYAAPAGSFVQVGEETRPLPPTFDLAGRRPLLVYGANAAPSALARKLAGLPPEPLPLVRAELDGFDVVYSAHLSPYGAVPATLRPSPGTTVQVFLAYPSAEQEAVLSATEPNYELCEMSGVELRTELGEPPPAFHVYLSRHGCLTLDGSEVALAAIEAAGRRLPALSEVEVLERVRRLLAPELDLGRFVETGLDPGLAAARTAGLRLYSD